MSPVTLTGELTADAQARRTTDGHHLLMLRLELPAGTKGRAVEVRTVKAFGTGPAADMACKSRARYMRRGVRVTVSGQRISWCRGFAQLEGLDYMHTPDLTVANRTGERDE